jgi:arabinose-5-phosphate isomerase
MEDQQILEIAHRVFEIEEESLHRVKEKLDVNFTKLAQAIYALPVTGKVIVTGMGKSGIIARKIAATLSSTGTLAIFLHPAEGVHGDLGIVQKDDVVIALSKSGETSEIIAILPSIQKIGAKLAAVVGNTRSSLARAASFVINASVTREACPLNLAPTASTTVALVIGDALSTVLVKMHNFTEENFALYHPAGSLGARLLLTCEDLMSCKGNPPSVTRKTSMSDVLIAMTHEPMGGIPVVDEEMQVIGIITDGDLRRALHKKLPVLELFAEDLMTLDPKVVLKSTKALEALQIMEEREKKILVLPVVDVDGRPAGMLRLHDLIEAGLKN